MKEKTQKEPDEEEHQEEQRIRAEEKKLERKEGNIRKRKRIKWTKEELDAMERQRPMQRGTDAKAGCRPAATSAVGLHAAAILEID